MIQRDNPYHKPKSTDEKISGGNKTKNDPKEHNHVVEGMDEDAYDENRMDSESPLSEKNKEESEHRQ
ncbi:MAG: hypothetical protein K2Q14_06270 [Gammaproteobacteria bacterium]|nr:hypothetical protein [Gammaproteobacteria bacterium]